MVEMYNAPISNHRNNHWFSGALLSNGIQLAQPSPALARVMKEGRHVTYFHWTSSDRTLNHLGFLRRVRSDKLVDLTQGIHRMVFYITLL